MKASPLVEHVADWHSHADVDRTGHLVRNVALTGGTSKNGYRYTEQALQAAVALYEQRPVFLDHAADRSRPRERSTRDLVGTIVNPRYESGRIRGDIRVLDTDSGRTFLALAESNAPGVGMSHVVLAERDGVDGAVTRIHDVVSVDAVVFPATTTTFRESHDFQPPAREVQGSDDDAAPSTELARDDEAAGRPAAVKAVPDGGPRPAGGSGADADPTSERLRELLLERDELLARLHEVQQREIAVQSQQAIAELLRESGLPDYAVTDSFCRQLSAADEPLRRELIRERQTLIAAAVRRLPTSHERSASTRAMNDDGLFVAAIKRHA